MSIQYHHSLALADLATVLQESIRTEQSKSPLQPPLVVIPNVNIERWLKIQLPILSASKMSLNIRYVFLEKILEELVITRTNNDDARITFYQHGEVEKLIFQYLNRNKEDKMFSFLGNYLHSTNRVFYLSSKLATYFKDYELNRAHWIHSWAKECGIEIPSFSKLNILPDLENNVYYQFEKHIYCELFFKKNPSIYTLSQFLLRSPLKKIDLTDINLHLFCLANLSDTYLHMLQELSSISNLNVHFYQFHSGNAQISSKQMIETPMRWSYPQTYLAHTLSLVTKILPRETDISSNTNSLPKGLLSLRNLMNGEDLLPVSTLGEYGSTEDGSVRIWNAPSVYREIEAVANDIIFKMNRAQNESTELSLLDFSILLTDINAYRSAIEWVFDGGILIETSKQSNKTIERQKIPYSLVDLKASDASPLYRALSDFWVLCSPSGFKFSEFQKLLRSPIINRYLLEDETILEDIEVLLSNLGIAYEDIEYQIENDPFQISNGIRRAVLSSILSEKTAESRFNTAPVQLQDDSTVIQLTEIWLRILDARNEVSSFLKLGSWESSKLESLRIALELLFQFDSEDLENRNQFHLFWDQLSFWKDVSVTEMEGLEILKMITFQAFDGIAIKKGDYLTGGVTISLLQPMRPLPFKHVYILGLGEGKFPGTNDNSRLNLRSAHPEKWDLNKKQIQESLLWESFFSAHESLTLSYVGKNTKEDKIFEPCSSLFEIMQGLGILKATEIPLVSYSRTYDHSEMAMKAGLISYDFSRSWVRNSDAFPQVLGEFQKPEMLISDAQLSVAKTKINISELIQFVKDPLDTYLKKKLGMYVSDEAESEKEEIFYLDPIQRSTIQKKVYLTIFENIHLNESKWDRKTIEQLLDPIIENEIRHARFPNQVYAKLEKENILDHFSDRELLFAEWSHLLNGAKYHRYVSFGNTGLNPKTCLKLPNLQFESKPNILLYLECEHVYELEGTYYLIYTKRIEADVEPNSEFTKYKDYFGNLIQPFLHWASFAMQGLSLKILATNMKSKDGRLIGSLDFQTDHHIKKATDYLEKLVTSFSSDKPQFFPRLLYLNFFYENFGKAKSEEFSDGVLLEKEEDWIQYQNDEIETLFGNLTPISRLYPKTNEFIFQPNIDFANEFYSPLSLWRQK